MPITPLKVSFDITGTATTMIRDGESADEARNRLLGAILYIEQIMNDDGMYRFHLAANIPEPIDEPVLPDHNS